MKISDDNLRGRVVLSSDGLAIGEIERLFIDPTNLRISSLEVRLRKDIADRVGAHRSLFHGATIEIPANAVQSTGDVVILSVPLDALSPPEAPEASAQAPAVH
jgi:sporulation protein YlmC with PRC-barrel domain